MPSRSDRHLLLTDIDQLIKTLAVNASPIPDSRHAKDIDELLAMRACLQASRYLNLRNYVKQKRTMADLLYTYDDKGFKAEVRMDKSSFTKIVEILSQNQIFHNKSRNRQTVKLYPTLIPHSKRAFFYSSALSTTAVSAAAAMLIR